MADYRSAAEAYVSGLAPYLSLALQQRQLQQQGAYQQGELGVQRGQLGIQQQQVGQTGTYQQGLLGVQRGQLGVQQQGVKAKAIEMVNQAAISDPFGMTGAMDLALNYAKSVGVGQPDLQAAGVTGQPGMQPTGQPGMQSTGQPGNIPVQGGMPIPGGIPGTEMGVSLGQAVRAGMSGPALLQYMPPGLRSTLQRINSGTEPPTTLNARNPRAGQISYLMSLVYPGFDSTNYGLRYQTAKDFAPNGKQSIAAKSIDQAIGHAYEMAGSINDLGNYGGIGAGFVNPVVNTLGPRLNPKSTGVQNFETNAMALTKEMEKAFAGAGGGNQLEFENWKESLPISGSPYQQRSYLLKGLSLLEQVKNALEYQYQRGFQTDSPLPQELISPASRQKLELLKTMDLNTGKMAGMPQAGGQQGAGQTQGRGAPTSAIQFLMAHPETAPQFRAKYGYLPNGG